MWFTQKVIASLHNNGGKKKKKNSFYTSTIYLLSIYLHSYIYSSTISIYLLIYPPISIHLSTYLSISIHLPIHIYSSTKGSGPRCHINLTIILLKSLPSKHQIGVRHNLQPHLLQFLTVYPQVSVSQPIANTLGQLREHIKNLWTCLPFKATIVVAIFVSKRIVSDQEHVYPVSQKKM